MGSNDVPLEIYLFVPAQHKYLIPNFHTQLLTVNQNKFNA